MSEEKKDASCPIQEAPLKIKKVTFWQQYRRKPLGMIGLAIVVIYVLGALAAPLITNYDPTKDLFLADNLAAPSWMRGLSAKYKNAPPTIEKAVGVDGWTVTEGLDYPLSPTTYDDDEFVKIELPSGKRRSFGRPDDSASEGALPGIHGRANSGACRHQHSCQVRLSPQNSSSLTAMIHRIRSTSLSITR